MKEKKDILLFLKEEAEQIEIPGSITPEEIKKKLKGMETSETEKFKEKTEPVKMEGNPKTKENNKKTKNKTPKHSATRRRR